MIHELSDKEFIVGIIKGDFNENDVVARCRNTSCLMDFFKMVYFFAIDLIQSEGINEFEWHHSDRKFHFKNSKDLRIYCCSNFTRIEDAISIIAKMIDDELEQPQQEKTISRKEHSIDSYILYQDKEKVKKMLLHFISGNKGTKAAMIILVAVELGLIKKPPTNMLKDAFELAGSKQGFDTAYRKYCADIDPKEKARRETTIKEIEITKNAINDFLRE